MTPEQALVTYSTGSYMLNAKAQWLLDTEVCKGCEPDILLNPAALEPVFRPLYIPPGTTALKDCPNWTYESIPDQQELARYRVWLSPDQPFNWNNLEQFVKQVSRISNRMGLEISGNQQKIQITIFCHQSDIPLIKTAFLSKLKACRLSLTQDESIFPSVPDGWNDILFCDYYPEPPYHHLLTRPDELHTTPFEALVTAIANTPSPATAFYQILFQPVSAMNHWHHNVRMLTNLEYKIKQITSLGPSARYDQQVPAAAIHRMAGDVETKAHNDKPFYAAALRVGVIGAGEKGPAYLQSLCVFVSLFQHGGRPLSFITQEPYLSVLDTDQIRQMFQLGLTHRPGFLVNSEELTGLMHFPNADITDHLVVEVDSVENLNILKPGVLCEGTPIGQIDAAGDDRAVCLPDRIRLIHIHLIGKMRQGKSTLMINMIMHDIQRGHGVAVFDPHHDLVEELLCLLPEEVIPRVIYFDPTDPNWVPIWNPLAKVPGQLLGRIADDNIGILKSFVTGWGDRMETFLRQAIFGLLHLPGSTYQDVYEILSNSENGRQLRKLVLEVVENEEAHNFWQNDISTYRPEDTGPPRHKLSKLLISDSAVSLMLSQPFSTFNFRRIMDDGMIFLADLSSNLGKEVKQTLGGFILSNMYISALSRSDLLPKQRNPFHLYIDEAYQFVTDTFEEIIAETPKYGLDMTLAHQYLKQFDAKKINALGTVGTTIVFNVDSQDASHLSKGFKNKVKIRNFTNLETGQAIIRCGSEIAKIHTSGPIPRPKVNYRDRIVAESRKKYYKPAAEVYRMIKQRRSRADKPFEPLASMPDNSKSPVLPETFEYDDF